MSQAYCVRLDAFEGPLDLLLHLIKEHRVDIHDIPVARITWQYLDHLAAGEQLNLDHAAEFLLMASTLLEIKARMLLPGVPAQAGGEPAHGDPRRDLVERLREYRSLRKTANMLGEHEAEAGRRFFPPRHAGSEGQERRAIEPLAARELAVAMAGLLRRRRGDQPRIVVRDGFSIGQKMRLIARALRGRTGATVAFWTLLRRGSGRREIIVTFLALLELLRLGWAHAQQERCYGRILVGRRGR